ncbi:MAG: hypothetical protein NZV14_19500 [Bryobacteraceae bacterium]|nr:hypothetical protein [Bryobacteraceae bacterium]MDW8380351.1 hypothetical protein [Bryobacterales bacterium]
MARDATAPLEGVFRLQFSFDIGEEIVLDELRELLKLEKPGREPAFRRLAPDYMRFERPPLEERLPAVKLATGEHFPARIRYFHYGVISIELELPFQGDWQGLIQLAAKWIDEPTLESVAEETARRQTARIAKTVRRPAEQLLSEDYTIIELRRALGPDGRPVTSSELLTHHGSAIAQIVRGELNPLSDSEENEVLRSSISYSPTDLLVVGWSAALVYDAQSGDPEPVVALLEYANTQLLEFRYYDQVLSSVLEKIYNLLRRRGGILRRWRMAGEAERLNAMVVEIRELTERADHAIKFLSDVYYARMYKLAAARIGVVDYRQLVDDKLRTASDLYRFLMDETHQGRAFILELMVVIILIIDLIYIFRGKG